MISNISLSLGAFEVFAMTSMPARVRPLGDFTHWAMSVNEVGFGLVSGDCEELNTYK